MGHYTVTHAGYSMFKACTKTVLERMVQYGIQSMKPGMMKKGHSTMRRGHMSHSCETWGKCDISLGPWIQNASFPYFLTLPPLS